VKPALFLLLASLPLAAEREGNFTIRFEPTAILQTGAPVPFEIRVTNDLRKPVSHAKATLQIEMEQHNNVKVFPAPEVSPGVYVAKPVFPESGAWSIYVEVRRNDQLSVRTIQFTVPK
jgi:hypothetical protein